MNNFQLFQVICQKLNWNPAQSFMYELIERFAHRKDDKNNGGIYDRRCASSNAQALLFQVEKDRMRGRKRFHT